MTIFPTESDAIGAVAPTVGKLIVKPCEPSFVRGIVVTVAKAVPRKLVLSALKSAPLVDVVMPAAAHRVSDGSDKNEGQPSIQ